jgi:hypothetical protein
MRPIYCPETPVRTYHYRLCNIPGERISHLKVVSVAVPKRFNVARLHVVLYFVKSELKLIVIGLALDVKLLVLLCLTGHWLMA